MGFSKLSFYQPLGRGAEIAKNMSYPLRKYKNSCENGVGNVHFSLFFIAFKKFNLYCISSITIVFNESCLLNIILAVDSYELEAKVS